MTNFGFLDRGGFRSTFYRTYIDEEKKLGNYHVEQFEKVDKEICYGRKPGSYENVDTDGIIRPGEKVSADDILISKTSPMPAQPGSKFTKRDHSVSNRSTEHGITDRSMVSTNAEGFKYSKVRVRSIKLPEIGDKFCLTCDHEVLTDSGWKPISEVSFLDKVATLVDGKRIEYSAIEEIYEFDHDGEMYHIESQQIDLFTTMNHRMWVKGIDHNDFELVEAKDIVGKGVEYQKNGEWMKKDYNFSLPKIGDFEEKPLDTESWLWFFGIWIGWGWSCVGDDSCQVEILTCEGFKDMLEIVCQKLGYNLKYKDDISYITDEHLSLYLSEYNNKRLPLWAWNLSSEQAKILTRAIMLTSANGKKYFTSFTQLVDDFQRLCLHAGWSCNKINEKEFEITENHAKVNYQLDKKDQIEEIKQYKGKVYCIQVPSHVFYVRRNGKGCWTGNSSRHGQKGTFGMIYHPEDMPFSPTTGMIPDFVINSHCIPGRMTIGHLLESEFAKASCFLNGKVDATAFEGHDREKEAEIVLRNHGFQRYGKVCFINIIHFTHI
jgi:hypothetical protein